MPKIKVSISAEEELLERVRATAERMRWSFTTATEVAFELFLKEFENARLLATLEVEAPEMEKAA